MLDDVQESGPVGDLTVESVVDTREWVEGADDKWHPIPGSGSGRSCDRCGRTHEIHATVTDSTGRTITVRGFAIAGAPWYTFSPSYVTFQSLMHYELDGKHAYGLMADTYGIEFLADLFKSSHPRRSQMTILQHYPRPFLLRSLNQSLCLGALSLSERNRINGGFQNVSRP